MNEARTMNMEQTAIEGLEPDAEIFVCTRPGCALQGEADPTGAENHFCDAPQTEALRLADVVVYYSTQAGDWVVHVGDPKDEFPDLEKADQFAEALREAGQMCRALRSSDTRGRMASAGTHGPVDQKAPASDLEPGMRVWACKRPGCVNRGVPDPFGVDNHVCDGRQTSEMKAAGVSVVFESATWAVVLPESVSHESIDVLLTAVGHANDVIREIIAAASGS